MNSKLLLLAGLCALCVEGTILRGENGDTNDATLASKFEATRNPAAALAKSTANQAATALLISSSSNSPHSTPDPTRQLWRAARTYLKRSKRRQQQRAAATRSSTRRRRRHK